MNEQAAGFFNSPFNNNNRIIIIVGKNREEMWWGGTTHAIIIKESHLPLRQHTYGTVARIGGLMGNEKEGEGFKVRWLDFTTLLLPYHRHTWITLILLTNLMKWKACVLVSKEKKTYRSKQQKQHQQHSTDPRIRSRTRIRHISFLKNLRK